MNDQETSFDKTVTYRRLKTRKITAWFSLVVILTLGPVLSYWLYEDALYFFRFGRSTDLGRGEEMGDLKPRHNDFVRVEGIARDMCIRSERFFKPIKYLYLLGSETGARMIVETRASQDEPCLGAVEQTFKGRLTYLDENGKYQNVLSHYRTQFTSAPREGDLYLLQDGRSPRTYWMTPLLFLVILIVWIINIRTLWRFRRNPYSISRNGGSP